MRDVKEMLRGMRNAVEVRKRRSGMGVNDERTMHMLFLGNPGTGKTKVARLVAAMLSSLGVLKKGQLVEVSRQDLIGAHHGETAQLTSDAVKKALGGVLFIDEAYALRHEGATDSAGQECVNTLVKAAEDHAQELVGRDRHPSTPTPPTHPTTTTTTHPPTHTHAHPSPKRLLG